MSKSLTVQVKSFPAGWFVVWNVTSQCYYTGRVEIKSGGRVLQTIEKNNHDMSFQSLGDGHAINPSTDMEIVITFNEATNEIDERHQPTLVLNKRGETVGIMMGMCVEDGGDQDYNDFYISMAAWEKEG